MYVVSYSPSNFALLNVLLCPGVPISNVPSPVCSICWVNISAVLWFATCNELTLLDSPVLSRFRVFDIAPPTAEQMRRVVESVNRELLAGEDWAVMFDPTLPEPILQRLQDGTPREIKQRLEDAYACAAVAGRCHLLLEDLNAKFLSSTQKASLMGFINTNTRP